MEKETQSAPTEVSARSSSPAAKRMRSYRKRRRGGMRFVQIELHVTEVDTLVGMGLLREEQRNDAAALQTAVLTIVYQALEEATVRRGVTHNAILGGGGQ